MSILSKNSVTSSTPFFREFTKQASFFLKEKIRSARLVLTDVTQIQLMTEEAINGNPSAPDTQTLGRISKAAFEVDDYWRIVDIMHQRLSRFEKKYWRESYNCLIVLEHLLTHGPESVAEEFQSDCDVIAQTGNFQYIDEKGFNWGLAVRKKSERVVNLLEKGTLLKEERDRARKLTRGIKGFGSFSHRTTEGILRESSVPTYDRTNSYSNPENQENGFQPSDTGDSTNGGFPDSANIADDVESGDGLSSGDSRTSFKENVEPPKEEQPHQWNCIMESRPLLDDTQGNFAHGIDAADDHPFNEIEHQTATSLLS